MPRPVKIACVQFQSLPASSAVNAPMLNLAKAHNFVRKAAKECCNIIIFPEYFISGVVADPIHHKLAQRAHTELNDPTLSEEQHWLESFRLLAIECKIDIVVGTIVEKAKVMRKDSEGKEIEKEVLHNVCHYIDSEGVILGRYVKNNLWWPEKDYLTSGGPNAQVFDTKWGKVGLAVCWDMAFAEAFRPLVEQGVELMLIPSFWTGEDGGEGNLHNPQCEELFLDSIVVSRAFENECAIVYVNCGGSKEEGYIGRSAVALPFKGVVGKAKSNEEEMFIVDIDLDILEDARKVYGIRRDLASRV